MSSHAERIVEREFSDLRKGIEDLRRRIAATVLSGHVAEIDGDYVRLELQPLDGRTGKPFLSPRVLVQEAAGGTGTKFPVAIGDPMRLLSPNGELGPASLAIRDAFTDERPNPGDGNEQLVIAHGGVRLVLAGGHLAIEADRVSNNGRNIGHNHLHGGVVTGGDPTDVPLA